MPSDMPDTPPQSALPGAVVDAVVIGRNEGSRLAGALLSLAGQVRHIVYVDSGSRDGSAALARDHGAHVIELADDAPFTAARARNAGLTVLAESGAEFVQLIDGDCRLQPGWVAKAVAAFRAHPQAAVICGRRRERFPQKSVYNRLCDREWDTPVGPALACGGDALLRPEAVRAVGGFRPSLIAGEEPDLCLRLRRAGWEVWRIDAEMTLHDAAMTRFGQWWQRNRRAGHAFAEGAALHGKGPERHWRRETRRALFWGLGLPLVALVAAWPSAGLSLALFAAYPLQMLRLGLIARPPGRWEWAFFTTLGKFAEAQGVLGYRLHRMIRATPRLIEYRKGPQ